MLRALTLAIVGGLWAQEGVRLVCVEPLPGTTRKKVSVVELPGEGKAEALFAACDSCLQRGGVAIVERAGGPSWEELIEPAETQKPSTDPQASSGWSWYFTFPPEQREQLRRQMQEALRYLYRQLEALEKPLQEDFPPPSEN